MEEWGLMLLGWRLEPEQLWGYQAAIRALIIYLVTLALVRLGKKRFMGRGAAFDVIVGIMIGSIASRAVTGNAPLETSSAGIAAILAIHWLLSFIAVHWPGFGTLVKGNSMVIVRDGVLDEKGLRRAHLTQADLEEELRGKGRRDLEGVGEGRIERDGEFSVIAADRPVPPKVIEISVRDGVQTVRVEIS